MNGLPHGEREREIEKSKKERRENMQILRQQLQKSKGGI